MYFGQFRPYSKRLGLNRLELAWLSQNRHKLPQTGTNQETKKKKKKRKKKERELACHLVTGAGVATLEPHPCFLEDKLGIGGNCSIKNGWATGDDLAYIGWAIGEDFLPLECGLRYCRAPQVSKGNAWPSVCVWRSLGTICFSKFMAFYVGCKFLIIWLGVEFSVLLL